MKSGKHHIDALAALLLFALYALCILGVLLSGTRVFSRVGDRDSRAFDLRSIDGYLATKLRQSDTHGGIGIEDGCLILAAEQGYETRIYCHDGYLCELFIRSGLSAEPEAGERLLPAESMSMSLRGETLSIDIVSGGEEFSVLYSPRCSREAVS